MPQITEYSAPEGLVPRPTDMALSTAREVGTAENRFARETGAAIGGAVARVGGQIGQVIDDHIANQMIGHGAASMAQGVADLQTQWNQLAAGSDPNDTSIAQGFREKVLEPWIEKFQSNFESGPQKAQNWALSQADRIRNEFYHTTTADMSTRAGLAVRQNAQQMVNSFQGMLAQNPDKLSFVEDTLKDFITHSAQSGSLTPDAQARLIEEGLPAMMKEAAKGAVLGMAVNNPDQALKDLDGGKFNKWFNPAEVASVTARVEQVKNHIEADKERALVFKERQARDVSEQRSQDYLADIANGQFSAKQALLDPKLTPEAKERLTSFAEARTRELRDHSENAQHPEAFSRLLTTALTDNLNGVPFNQQRVDGALALGQISYAEWTKLSTVGRREDNPFDRNFNAEFTRVQHDFLGPDSLFGITNRANPGAVSAAANQIFLDARATIDKYQQEGKDVRPLLNPQSPDYLFSTARMQTYTGSTRQQLSAQADAIRKGSTAPASDVAAVKANPALAARFQAKYGYLPDGMTAGEVKR